MLKSSIIHRLSIISWNLHYANCTQWTSPISIDSIFLNGWSKALLKGILTFGLLISMTLWGLSLDLITGCMYKLDLDHSIKSAQIYSHLVYTCFSTCAACFCGHYVSCFSYFYFTSKWYQGIKFLIGCQSTHYFFSAYGQCNAELLEVYFYWFPLALLGLATQTKPYKVMGSLVLSGVIWYELLLALLLSGFCFTFLGR